MRPSSAAPSPPSNITPFLERPLDTVQQIIEELPNQQSELKGVVLASHGTHNLSSHKLRTAHFLERAREIGFLETDEEKINEFQYVLTGVSRMLAGNNKAEVLIVLLGKIADFSSVQNRKSLFDQVLEHLDAMGASYKREVLATAFTTIRHLAATDTMDAFTSVNKMAGTCGGFDQKMMTEGVDIVAFIPEGMARINVMKTLLGEAKKLGGLTKDHILPALYAMDSLLIEESNVDFFNHIFNVIEKSGGLTPEQFHPALNAVAALPVGKGREIAFNRIFDGAQNFPRFEKAMGEINLLSSIKLITKIHHAGTRLCQKIIHAACDLPDAEKFLILTSAQQAIGTLPKKEKLENYHYLIDAIANLEGAEAATFLTAMLPTLGDVFPHDQDREHVANRIVEASAELRGVDKFRFLSGTIKFLHVWPYGGERLEIFNRLMDGFADVAGMLDQQRETGRINQFLFQALEQVKNFPPQLRLGSLIKVFNIIEDGGGYDLGYVLSVIKLVPRLEDDAEKMQVLNRAMMATENLDIVEPGPVIDAVMQVLPAFSDEKNKTRILAGLEIWAHPSE